MRENKTLQQDGIVETKSILFQSFVANPRINRDITSISIPKQIANMMKLTKNSILQIAIRHIPEEEAKAMYHGKALREKWRQTVECPICHKQGTLWSRQRYLLVSHTKKHGFPQNIIHYIKKSEFADFYEKHKERIYWAYKTRIEKP